MPGVPPRQNRTPCNLVRATGTFDPGRLPLVRLPRLAAARSCSRSLDVRARAASEHPFVRRSQTHHRLDEHRFGALLFAALASLSAFRSGVEKMPLTSLCNRSTIRAPTDRSIPRRLAYAAPTARRPDTCSERQCGVGSPCGEPTPGGYVLDGTFPTLGQPSTTLP
jgi:hypothetical protein